MNKYTLLAFFIVCCNLSCNYKGEYTHCKFRKIVIPQLVKDYFYFKVGTYWVYQNQTTQELDSQWICTSDITTRNIYSNNKCNCYHRLCFENMKVIKLSTKENDCVQNNTNTYSAYFIDVPILNNFTKNDYYYGWSSTKGNSTFYRNNYNIKPISGAVFYSNGNWFGYGLKDTTNCVVNGVTYNNCKIQRDSLHTLYDHYKEVLLVQNIGVVSYKDTSYTKWNLIRSYIIQ
jgi:hypothetical protein